MKEMVSWQDIEDYVLSVVRFYKNRNLPGVYGLPRGGLVFAVMISHQLNIPLLAAPVKNCLIVDDICDSGESLVHYYKNSSSLNSPPYHISTMYYKQNELAIPEIYYKEKHNNWVVFPWESC